MAAAADDGVWVAEFVRVGIRNARHTVSVHFFLTNQQLETDCESVATLARMGDRRGNRRELHAQLTRTAVLDAARALFVAKGFEATSVDDIAHASQSSKGAVYYHFRDKQAIFSEVFRASQAAIMQAVLPTALESMPDDASPWEQALLAIRAVLQCYVEDDVARVLLRESASALGWDRKQAVDEELALPLLRAVLTELIDAGEVVPVPVGVAAELLYALLSKTGPIIAAAEDPAQAITEIEPVLFKLLNGLHREPDAPKDENSRLGFAHPQKPT
jgi:AcrR family transcriptional regulator